MNTVELLAHIKSEVEKATLEGKKDAVNMYLVIKHYDQLKDMNAVEFAKAIGRTENYKSEFTKGLRLAEKLREEGYEIGSIFSSAK